MPAKTDASESEFGQMIVLRKAAGPGLPIEAALTLTEAARKALMSNAGAGRPMTEQIHGHNGDTHCAVVALPFVDREHADGHLMGFAVVLPRRSSTDDRRSVLAACSELAERGLHIPGVGNWTLEPADAAVMAHTLRSATWTQPSTRWRTVTPILLDRFPKKKGPGVEEILAAGCRRIGLREPAKIEHGPYSPITGVAPVPAFRLHRTGEERPRWGVHATFEFEVPVRGPVLVGAGRYFGLGLMRPQREAEDGR
jgi:CRISPR-associated protein Csb2